MHMHECIHITLALYIKITSDFKKLQKYHKLPILLKD